MDKNEIKKIKKLNKPHKEEEKKINNSNNNVIELKNMSKKYVTGKDIFEALSDINLAIEKGSFVVIVGKSGSGKSTLMNIMSGLIRPTEGWAIVQNNNLISFKNKELTNFRSENCGFIFQQYGLLSTLTVEENIYTGLNLKYWNKYLNEGKQKNNLTKEEKAKKKLEKKEKNEKYLDDKMYDIMKMVGIYELRNKYPSQLSGGQQQRVSIARALVKEPKILFGDEPTGAVDSTMTLNILQLLKKVNSEGTTIVLITHDQRLTSIADHVIEIQAGKIIKNYKQEPLKNYENLFI